MWRLLASDLAPATLGLMQAHLYEADGGVPGSLLHPRIERDLVDLRAQGVDMPLTAQHYVAYWLSEGWVERRLPPGASEEIYELSSAAEAAIRFAAGLDQPRAVATESRLAIVIGAIGALAEDTDTDKERRIARLVAERERIDADILAIESGRMSVLPDSAALERTREIIGLAEDLMGDFRRVREEFERLNRDLRASIMEHGGSRGEVLDAVFTGIDVIADSEAGRTFDAFWRLVNDSRESTAMDEALANITKRDFVARLEGRERRFLRRLPSALLKQGEMVHDVLQLFARNLKRFVQSREYVEHRRINQLIRAAQSAALAAKETVRPFDPVFTLPLTSTRVSSLSQWTFFDMARQAPVSGMAQGEAARIDLDTVGDLVAQSEIDFRTLEAHVVAILADCAQATIGQVLERFPAEQGLGSVVGLLALGSRHGIRSAIEEETVEWVGGDGIGRWAIIPTIHFTRECLHGLA